MEFVNEGTLRRLAWPTAWTSIGLAIIALTLSLTALTAGGAGLDLPLHQIFSPIFAISYSLIGGLVAARRPRNPVGWISTAIGFFSALSMMAISYEMLSRSPSISLPMGNLALWIVQWAWFPPAILPMNFLLLLFPDGHLPSPRWRPVAWASAAGLIVTTLFMAILAAMNPGAMLEMETVEATLGEQALGILYIAVLPPLLIGVIGSVASLVVRFRRSAGMERQQLKWMAYAGGVLILGVLFGSFLPSILPDSQVASELGIILTSAVQLGIVIAAAIAILRYRLYEIDILINRTLVYGALTAITVSIYILFVGYFGKLLKMSDSSIIPFLATGIVAVAFQPLRERLQRVANRLMYGERDDPFSVISQLSIRIEAASQPEVVLPSVVETVANALKLPYVAIEFANSQSNQVIASIGQPQDDSEKFPLIHQSEIIGYLIVACRGAGEGFDPSELRLLRNIARQTGVAVHAVQLTMDLRRSRQQLVTTREEERRRLRRDLHDGLGPVLASQSLKLAAASQILAKDPAQAKKLLDEINSQNEATLEKIRALVYALRPATLDELGLVGAVRDLSLTLSLESGSKPGVRTEVLEPKGNLPTLPAAVEVAAYRIATEALTNVHRHSGAQHCIVTFEIETLGESRTLNLSVEDDGSGIPRDRVKGLGMTTMRERAEEIGGWVEVESNERHGTRMCAVLPLVE